MRGDLQCDPDGADEGDGSPEQAVDEPHRLADPVHRVQQLILPQPDRAETRASFVGAQAQVSCS